MTFLLLNGETTAVAAASSRLPASSEEADWNFLLFPLPLLLLLWLPSRPPVILPLFLLPLFLAPCAAVHLE